MSILIIDDSAPIVRLLEAALQRNGYEDIYCASSGSEALEFLGLPQQNFKQVDCILLDIIMPSMDGITVCRKIKEHNFFADTPIIMVTIRDEPETLHEAFEAGAVEYITKPVRELELITRVNSAVKLSKEISRRKIREAELLKIKEELEAANERLVALAITDKTTSVNNRRHFDKTLHSEWRRAFRDAKPLAMFIIEFDSYHEYIAEYGKAKTDNCLKLIAQVFESSLHRVGDHICRYADNQFAICLSDTDLRGAMIVAGNMKDNLDYLKIDHPASKSSPYISASIGVAALQPRQDVDLEDLRRQAEECLRQAVKEGRNRIIHA